MSNLNVDYLSMHEKAPNSGVYEVLLGVRYPFNPATALVLQDVAKEYGYEVTVNTGTGEIKIENLNAENGMTIKQQIENLQRGVANNVNSAQNVNLNFTTPVTFATGSVNAPTSYKDTLWERFTRDKDKVRAENRLQQLLLNTSDADINHIIQGGIDRVAFLDIMNAAELTPVDADNIIKFIVLLQSNPDYKFVKSPLRKKVLDIILKFAYTELFQSSAKNYFQQIISQLGTPPNLDYRKLDISSINMLFEPVGLSFYTLSEEQRSFFADLLRNIKSQPKTPLSPEVDKLLEILAMPVGISIIETGSLPNESIAHIIKTLNYSPDAEDELSNLLKIEKIDPKFRSIYRNLRILSLLDLSPGMLETLIFKEDLSPEGKDQIVIDIIDRINEKIPEYLYRSQSRPRDSLLYGETLGFLQYLYQDPSGNPGITPIRESFLNELAKKFNANPFDEFQKGMFEVILEIMNSGLVVGYKKENADERRQDRVGEVLKQTKSPKTKLTLPSYSRSNFKPTLQVSITGLPEDYEAISLNSKGTIPELVNLYIQNPEEFATNANYEDIRFNILKIIEFLQLEGIYDYIVDILQNSSDEDNAYISLVETFYNTEPVNNQRIYPYIENLTNIFKTCFKSGFADTDEASKYISARFIVDMLAKRTKKDEAASRLETPANKYGITKLLNIPSDLQGIIQEVSDAQGNIDLTKLTRIQREIFIKRIRTLELQRGIIKILEDKKDSLTPDDIDNLIDQATRAFISNEGLDGKSVFDINESSINFKKNLKVFIDGLLNPPDITTGLGINFESEKEKTLDTLETMYIVIGKKGKLFELRQGQIYDDLDKVEEDIKVFVENYREDILNKNIEMEQGRDLANNMEDSINHLKNKLKSHYEENYKDAPSSDFRDTFRKNSRVKNIKNTYFKSFLNGVNITTKEEYSNYLAFVDVIGNLIDLESERDYEILFYLLVVPVGIFTSTDYKLRFKDKKTKKGNSYHEELKGYKPAPPRSGYSEKEIKNLANHLLKAQLRAAVVIYEEQIAQQREASRLNERDNEKKDNKKESHSNLQNTPETININGTEVKSQQNKRSVKKLAQSIIRNRGKIGAVAGEVAGGAFVLGIASTGNIPGALIAGELFFLPVSSARILQIGADMRKDDRKKYIETINANVELLRQDLQGLPEVVRNHTQNLINAKFAEKYVEESRKNLKNMRENIYPKIQSKLDKSKASEIQEINLNLVPKATRVIDKSMSEIMSLLRDNASGKPIDPAKLEKRIVDLLRKINEAMFELTTMLENLINDVRLRKKNWGENWYKELRILEESYGSAA